MNHNMHINPITTGTYADLKERQQIFVDALVDDGCSGYTVTRRQVVTTAERCGYPGSFPWPSWLTADMDRRIDRGIFSLPELGDRVDVRQASDDLPETMEYISNGLMAQDMTMSATCYNDGLASVTMPDAMAVCPDQQTDGDDLDDSITIEPSKSPMETVSEKELLSA